ncbi:MAG: transporter [Chthoniobacteraceae bacterium]
MPNPLSAASLAALLCFLPPTLARADEKPADKSHYSLFSPVPAAQMREFDTDRPDKTNSPHTLDAGHFQLEMDAFAFSHDRNTSARDFVRNDNWTFANANLRIGLTNWLDLQLLIPFYQVNRDHDLAAGTVAKQQGIGDLTVALKMNFWGNDGGKTAGALGFFVKAPTANHNLGNGQVEGGAVILLGATLPGDFNLSFNTGVNVTANDTGSGHHAEFINSVSVSRKIFGPLSAYAEFWTDISVQAHAPVAATVDGGFLLMLGKNVQLDTGVNLGVTRTAPDVQTFFGLTVRF